MSEAEDWAVIVRAKNQEIQKWQQQALELSNLVAPLRDEVARLKERMQQAYDYINDHRHGKAKAMLFDGLQLYKPAALTPQAGKGGGA